MDDKKLIVRFCDGENENYSRTEIVTLEAQDYVNILAEARGLLKDNDDLFELSWGRFCARCACEYPDLPNEWYIDYWWNGENERIMRHFEEGSL